MVINGEGQDHRDDEDLGLCQSPLHHKGGCWEGTPTRVRLLDTCLMRIVHTDSPRAPSTLLGPWCCRRRAASEPSIPFSRSVSSRAQTSGTESVWADSVVKAGAVSTVLLMEPRPTVASASASVASASVPVVPARVGDGGGQDAELLKPHIGGSVCPSTSSSFSVPIQ
jgi:hypothetical protein